MNQSMISTRKRETVTFEVDPRITHKASGLAVERGCTTVDILREWVEIESGFRDEIAREDSVAFAEGGTK